MMGVLVSVTMGGSGACSGVTSFGVSKLHASMENKIRKNKTKWIDLIFQFLNMLPRPARPTLP